MKSTRIIFLLLLLAFMFFAGKFLLVKKSIESTTSTTIYDNAGIPIFKNPTRTLTLNDMPKLLINYIEIESNDKDLPELLFPINSIDYKIAEFYVSHFINEDERRKYYFNHLYFQNGIVGYNMASEYYFDKSIDQLSIIENIFLLSKTVKYDSNTKTNFTLFVNELYRKRLISKAEEVLYVKEIPSVLKSLYNRNSYAQSYTNFVIDELKKNMKMNEEELFQKGYSIYTNLDSNIEMALYEKQQAFVVNTKNFKAPIESGIALIENRTGKIVGLQGGRDYQHNDLNRTYQITRQPASTLKPLMVYAPAIEMGWKSTDKLQDVPMRFGNFKPRNYDFKYRGEVSIKQAIINSYNVPTAWLLSEIGLDNGISYVNKFNVFDINKKDGFGLALGFTSVGTSPLALAQAYSTFTNDGKMVKAHAVQKVTGFMGRHIYKVGYDGTQIFTPKTARAMKELLIKVVEEGAGEKAKVTNQLIAGKTGSTSYDAWFVGFNEKYVGAIWMGPDEVKPQNRIDISGGDSPATLFSEIFRHLD